MNVGSSSRLVACQAVTKPVTHGQSEGSNVIGQMIMTWDNLDKLSMIVIYSRAPLTKRRIVFETAVGTPARQLSQTSSAFCLVCKWIARTIKHRLLSPFTDLRVHLAVI
jgi:hypothetical protein